VGVVPCGSVAPGDRWWVRHKREGMERNWGDTGLIYQADKKQSASPGIFGESGTENGNFRSRIRRKIGSTEPLKSRP